MPKVQENDALRLKVKAIVEVYGNYALAAKALGVSHATLWRFANTGRAIERTRQRLEDAVTCHRQDGKPGLEQWIAQLAAQLHHGELSRIRTACQTLIAVVDAVEASAIKSP